MINVKMRTTATGADDRVTVKTYQQGEVYALSDELAALWLASGVAEAVGVDAPPVKPRRVRRAVAVTSPDA